MSRGGVRSPLPWLAGLLICYLGVPVVAFCVRLVTTGQRGFGEHGLFPALAVSVMAACVTTVVATLLGVPLAFLLARSKGRLASAVGLVVQLPLAVPPVMGGILLIYLVGPYTWLGRLFGGGLTESLTGIVLAQTFVASPFLIVAARSSFAALDGAFDDVAATLGHEPLGRFLRVAVPMAGPGIRAGMVLTWLRAFGEYGATVVLAYHPTSLPVYTFTQFSAKGLPDTMAPTALALGVAVVAVALSRVVRLPVRAGWRPGARTVTRPEVRATLPRGVGGVEVRRVPQASVGFDVTHRLGTFELAVAHQPSAARLAVLGPSGSGKSTLLRCVAGLHGQAPGAVWYGDRRVEQVPVERRRVGYVAQSFGLFPHLRVWEQLVFATDADPAVAAQWLVSLRLEGLEDRWPSQLSGGQRQRVALAQALSRSPEVLLLDEPFSALDTPVRHELQRELRRLQRDTGVATVLVTHDPEEAALLADEIMVVDDGRVVQEGTTRQVFRRPASPAVARLVGVPNLGRGVVAAPGLVALAPGAVVTAETRSLVTGAPVLWSVRPELVVLASTHTGEVSGAEVVGVPARQQEGGSARTLSGVVSEVIDLGWGNELLVAIGSETALQVRTTASGIPEVGEHCRVHLPPGAVSVWPAGAEDWQSAGGMVPVGGDKA